MTRGGGHFGILARSLPFLRPALGLLVATAGLGAEQEPGLRPFPSLQGFTGLLNTPNALVTQEGTADLMYSGQMEPQWRDRVPWTDNYLVSVGVLPFIEGGFRLMNADGLARDFSTHVKVQIPFLPRGFPKLALGIQDFGGAASFFRTKYGVLSQDFGRLHLSLGYGTGPDRMKGLFGGAELSLADWLQVVWEDDTVARNVGLRLSTAQGWLPASMSLGALVKEGSAPRGQHADWAFFLKVPLGHASPRVHTLKPAPPEPEQAPSRASSVAGLPAVPAEVPPETATVLEALPPGDTDAYLATLSRVLTEQGFENVRVGTRGATLVIQYENHRYNHNELDGLGVVLGTALESAPASLSAFQVAVKRQNIRVLDLSGPSSPFQALFRRVETPSLDEIRRLGDLLRVEPSESFHDIKDVQWLMESQNASALRASLLLYPGLDQAVGTEVGTFDYRLSLLVDLKVALWPGGQINARWDQPVSWSENYRDGGLFGTQGTVRRMDRLMVQQAIPLAPGLMTQFSAGRYLYRSNGWLNETIWSPGTGQHQFQVTAGQFKVSDGSLTKVLIGTYRFYLPAWDTFLEAAGGGFYNRDSGYRLDLKRYFGDTAFSLYYAKTSESIAGFVLTLPLTPRRDMKPALVQVRGWERWNYGLHSVVIRKDQTNPLTPGLAVTPETAHSLRAATYDGNRLNESYLKEHLPRLREAYLRWKTP